MFCKFVIKIRHLSIKIIYASRTGQMIVLYNPINSNNPDQKPDCMPCFLSMHPPHIYSFILYFSICTFGQCAIYSLGLFYPLTGGRFTFWFNPPAAYSWVCVPLTRQPQNPTPRILTSKTPYPYHTPTPKLYKILTQFNKPLR